MDPLGYSNKEIIEAVDRLKAAWGEMKRQLWDEIRPYVTLFMDAQIGKYGVPWMLAAWLLFWLAAGFLFVALVLAPLLSLVTP